MLGGLGGVRLVHSKENVVESYQVWWISASVGHSPSRSISYLRSSVVLVFRKGQLSIGNVIAPSDML